MSDWAAADGVSRSHQTISVLLATTGRPDMAEAFAKSLVDTTRGHLVELVCAVDADVDTRHRLEALDVHDGMSVVMDWRYDHRGCSRAWNDALRLSSGDPVVLAADDLEFQPGWLEAALACLSGFDGGWGFVGFNDGHDGADLSTHYLVSRRLIQEAFGGVIAWEHYEHSFNDVEANERAKRAGRYQWCQDAHVKHTHWLFGDRSQDTTDTKNLGGHPASAAMFSQRQAAGFPNDFEAVI